MIVTDLHTLRIEDLVTVEIDPTYWARNFEADVPRVVSGVVTADSPTYDCIEVRVGTEFDHYIVTGTEIATGAIVVTHTGETPEAEAIRSEIDAADFARYGNE